MGTFGIFEEIKFSPTVDFLFTVLETNKLFFVSDVTVAVLDSIFLPNFKLGFELVEMEIFLTNTSFESFLTCALALLIDDDILIFWFKLLSEIRYSALFNSSSTWLNSEFQF